MKRRLGFVTNSSSTNSIIKAAATAVTSGIVSAVINVDISNEENQIVETANLIVEVEASHPEKCLRVNDASFSVNIFAKVRKRKIHYVPSGGSLCIDKVEEDYSYTERIEFVVSEQTRDWVSTSDPGMVGDDMAMAMVGESIDYENRHFQPDCPSQIAILVKCQVEGYELSDVVSVDLLDEALLFGRSTYALNDETVTTKVPIELYYGWPYDWRIEHELCGNQLEGYCQMQIEASDAEVVYNRSQGKAYNLVVTPLGKKIPSETKGPVSLQSRIDVKGIPNNERIADVKDFLDLTLIEEGLFFEGETDRKGSLMVESYLKSVSEDGPNDIKPTRFKLKCVVKKENETGGGSTAEFLDMDGVEVVFGDLIGTNTPSENLVQVYKYEVKKTDLPGTYEFKPLMSVPFSENPLNIVLPVSCEIKNVEYMIEMPINIQGQPFGRSEAWEKELDNLIYMIKNYVEPEKQLAIIQQIKIHKARLSVESLRLFRRQVWEDARRDLLEEAKDHMATADMYEWAEFGAGALKWAGDQAFAYLMYYWGGKLAEAFLVPFKDIVVTLIGELSAEYFFGSGTMTEEQMYTANLNSIIGFVENEIMRDFDLKDLSLAKVGRYFAALATVNFLKHYYLDTKPDGSPIGFWDALVSTCSDLSVNYFKALVGSKFEELMKMPETKAFFEKYASKYVKEMVYKVTDNFNIDQLNVVGKYLSEMTGVVTATVNGEIIKNTSVRMDPNDIIITIQLDEKVTVDISLMQLKDDLFAFIFNNLFANFPYSPSGKKLVTPAMPPYYSS